MSFAQVRHGRSAKSIAKSARADALRTGGFMLAAFDEPSCAKLEKVTRLLAEDERIEISLMGHPRIEERFLAIYPAGGPYPAVGQHWVSEYETTKRERKRPLGPWERQAIIDQFDRRGSTN